MDNITNFSLEQHSFLFPNRFKLNPIWFMASSPLYYGLCGGMCFAALDIYNEKKQTPKFSHPDQLPKPLFNYLISRQMNSTNIRSMIRLIRWIFLKDLDLFQISMGEELPAIINKLKSGNPVPIIIVRSKKFTNPTQNHQILVIDFRIENQVTILKTYDPNYPNCFTEMHIVNLERNVQITQSTGENVRGFFINSYKPKSPAKMVRKMESLKKIKTPS